MSERKRKRDEDSRSERPHKKTAKEATPEIVNVSVVKAIGDWPPILASTPGLSLPSKVSFRTYRSSNTKGSEEEPEPSKILLHSSSHPTIDYTAQEESSSHETLLNHYVGIYDPARGELKLVPARGAIVRRTLRAQDASGVKEGDEDPSSNPLSARSALGLAFGTKKSQKAIRALTENAITSPSKSTHDSPQKTRLDPAASIILETMAASATSILSRKDMQDEVNQGKPIPKPNLEAEIPAEVYPLEQLVGLPVLRILPVRDWIEKVEAGEEITTKSRFVSNRIVQVVRRGDVKMLKALKYLLLLLEWYICLKTTPKAKKVPRKEDIAKAIPWANNDLLEGVQKRFGDEITLSKWQIQNLQTHICALSLTIDAFTTDMHDLCADLRTDTKKISKLYVELGCRVSIPTDTEAEKMGLGNKKKEAAMRRLAKLRIPLQFPQLRGLGVRGRGRGRGR